MNKLRQLLEQVRSSLWFVPTLIVIAAVGMAFGLIEAESAIERDKLIARWPWLFGPGRKGRAACWRPLLLR